MSPPEFWKAAVVAVRRNPFAAGFYGKSGKVGVGDDVAFHAADAAEFRKDVPVPRPGCDMDAVGLLAHVAAERQRGGHGARWRENGRVRDDPHESVQHQV